MISNRSILASGIVLQDVGLIDGYLLNLKRQVYIWIMAICAIAQAVFGVALLFDNPVDGVTQLVFALLAAGTIVLIRQGRAIKAIEGLLCIGPFAFNAYQTWYELILLQQHESIEFYFAFANYALVFLILPANVALAVSGGMIGLYIAIMAYHGLHVHAGVGLSEFYAPVLAQILLLTFLYVLTRLREQYQRKLQHQAFHDPLTQLLNRIGFMQRLEQSQKGTTGILLIDLDNFKEVNDTYGHEMGDQILLKVADRLRKCCETEQWTLARFSGDEFTVLVPQVLSSGTLNQVGDQIQAIMSDSFVIHNRSLYLSCSIGMSVRENDCTPSDLLRQADMAMYHAKRTGKASNALFVPEMEQAARERLKLQSDLRYALERAEFILHYQPIVDVPTGQLTTVEALVRWEHPEHGLLPPGRFLSTAEEMGLIIPIGQWVLEESCRQIAAWRRALPAELVPMVSVNLSVSHLEDPGLVPFLADLLERHGISGERLQIEVTESVLTSDAAHTSQVLQDLKRMGLSVALDDFGTGYSSLSYLSRLPVDVLKIDRSFLFGLQESEQNRVVLNGVIQVGHALNLQVTAEGVETAEQLLEVQKLGFDRVQGYHIARPKPAELITEMLLG